MTVPKSIPPHPPQLPDNLIRVVPPEFSPDSAPDFPLGQSTGLSVCMSKNVVNGAAAVVARAVQGDATAWGELVRDYTPRVYGLLFRQCRDRDLAEELTQATFVRVFEQMNRYDEQGRFDPWLFRIAMNLLRDEMRRRSRQAKSMDMSEDGFVPRGGQDGTSPSDRLERDEQIERLRRAVDTMNDADREILYLRHTAGLSFADVAETLGQPLGTVLARGHRALGKLKKMLGDG